MARKVYGLHARDHMPGGADPIPGVGSWCGLSRTTAVTVDSGTSHDTDAFVDWETFFASSGGYFAQMTDGNGVEGVKILKPGLYAIVSSVTVREFNASDVIPPSLRWTVAYALDGSDDFGTGSFGESLNGGWLALNPAGTPYVPPTISPLTRSLVLGGTFVFPFTSVELGSSSDSVTCRIASDGGTDDWQWYPASLKVHYLGPVLES